MGNANKKSRTSLRRSQGGFGLMEVGLALLIIAIMGIFAYNQYNTSREDVRAEGERDEVTAYLSRTQEKYSNAPDYTGVSTATLVANRVFPLTMVSGTTVSNKYGGSVSAAATPDNLGVIFTSTNYSQDGCVAVVPKVVNAARKVTVGSTVVKNIGGTLNVASLGTACVSGVTILYEIGR